jgi:hypothetical protein
MQSYSNSQNVAAPAWWGFCSDQDRGRLQALISKARRWGLYSYADYTTNMSSFDSLCDCADKSLFSEVLGNPVHVLHQLLPPKTTCLYKLRNRPRNRVLPKHNTDASRNFIHRNYTETLTNFFYFYYLCLCLCFCHVFMFLCFVMICAFDIDYAIKILLLLFLELYTANK